MSFRVKLLDEIPGDIREIFPIENLVPHQTFRTVDPAFRSAFDRARGEPSN